MKKQIILIISLLVVSIVLAGDFPRIAFMDPLSVHQWEGHIHYQSAIDSAWYVPQMKRCGMNIIHTKAFNNENSHPAYLDILEANGMTLAQEDFNYENIKYIHNGFYEHWPIGYDTKVADYERHLSGNGYTIADSAPADFGQEEITLDSTIYYFYSLAGVHSAGKVLDGSAFKAGYWRYGSVPIKLLIKAKIENAEGRDGEIPVVTCIVYEKPVTPATKDENIEALINRSHPSGYITEIIGDSLPNAYSLTFTISDFTSPGEWQKLLHPTVMNSLDDAGIHYTYVDMIWHGTVDFYLDGFELRSEKNYNITCSPLLSNNLNVIQSRILSRSSYNGQSRGLVWNYYFDEPWYNQYQSYGILNGVIRNTYSSQSLTGATGGRSPSDLSKYRYLESTGNAYLIYNFYPFGGERTVSQALDALTERLNSLKGYSLPRNIPLMPGIQVHEGIKNDIVRNADVSPAEIWAQGWLAIAHGAQGLLYFLYSTFEYGYPDVWSYRGLVDINGNPAERNALAGPYVPNEKYDAVQSMNQHIAAIEDILTETEWNSTYHFHDSNVSIYPFSNGVCSHIVTGITVTDGSSRDVEVGHFSDSEGNTILVIVNRNTLTSKNIQVTMNQVNQIMQIEDLVAARTGIGQSHQLMTATSPRFNTHLEPGEGRVFRLSTGITGTLSKNESWQGDILLDGTLVIGSSQKLSIRASSHIYANSTGQIQNNGTLEIQGTPASVIEMKGLNGNVWPGIDSWGDFVCQNCVIENASTGIDIENGSFSIHNCEFAYNGIGMYIKRNGIIDGSNCHHNTTGIYLSVTGGLISDNSFTYNTYALKGYYFSGSIEDNNFQHNARALWFSRGQSIVKGNQFFDNDFGIVSNNVSTDDLNSVQTVIPNLTEVNNYFYHNIVSVQNDYSSRINLGTQTYLSETNIRGGWNRFNTSIDYDLVNESGTRIYAQVNDWINGPKIDGLSWLTPDWDDVFENPGISKHTAQLTSVNSDSIITRAEKYLSDSLFIELRAYSREFLTATDRKDIIWPIFILNECVLNCDGDTLTYRNWLSDIELNALNDYTKSVANYFLYGSYPKTNELSNGIHYLLESIDLLESLSDTAFTEEYAWHLFEAAYWTQNSTAIGKNTMVADHYLSTLESQYHWTSAYEFLGESAAGRVSESMITENYTLIYTYPNPFNAGTTVYYQIPEDSQVEITIYNIRGQKMGVLLRGKQLAGDHHFYWDASTYSSGIYLIQCNSGNYHQTIKTVLLK